MRALSAHKYTSLYLLINLIIGLWFIVGALQFPAGPALFPTIIGWGLVGIVVIHTVIEVVRARRVVGVPKTPHARKVPAEKHNVRPWKNIAPAALFLFVIVVPYLGLYPSIAIFLGTMLPLVGQRKWYVVAITIAAVLLGTYLVFDYALNVPLPSGMFF